MFPLIGISTTTTIILLLSHSQSSSTVVVSKCCEEWQVFYEMTAECAEGHFAIEALRSFYDEDDKEDPPLFSFQTGALQTEDCPNGSRRILMPAISSSANVVEDQFQVMRDGRLFLPRSNVHLDLNGYCLEQSFPSQQIIAVVCQPPSNQSMMMEKYCFRETLYTVGMCASALSLALICGVYILLPDLRNAPGQNVLSLAFSLMIAYTILVSIRLGGAREAWPSWACTLAALAMYFFFMAAFAWMTVISWDIFLVFGLGKKVAGKRRMFYPLLAWGWPTLSTTITLMAQEGLLLSWPFRPHIGLSVCWFHSYASILLYFYGPIGFLLLANWLLFCLTAQRLHRQVGQKQQQQQQPKQASLWRRHSKNRGASINDGHRMLQLHLKLFIVMGLSWLFEILSGAWPAWPASSGGCWTWSVATDLVNALQGVWMLLIYLAKKDVWQKVKLQLMK